MRGIITGEKHRREFELAIVNAAREMGMAPMVDRPDVHVMHGLSGQV